MANETVELLFRFLTSGQRDIDQAATSVEKLVVGAGKGSAPVDKLGESVKEAGTKVKETGKDFDGLAEKITSGLSNPLGAAGGVVEGFLSKIGKTGVIIGAVATGIGVLGQQALDFVSAAGGAAEETLNLAARLDLSANATERLQAQAKIANVNLGSLEGAARVLSQALEDPAGQGERTALALQKMGISVVTVSGQLREPGPILLDLLDKLAGVEKASERTFLAQQVLPKAAVKELVPLISSYGELKTAITELGIGVDEGLTKNLAAADDEIDKLELAWERLKKSFAGKIAPIVVPVVMAFTKSLSSDPKGVSVGPSSGALTTSTQDARLGIDDEVRKIITGRMDESRKQADAIIKTSLDQGKLQADAFRESRKNSEAGTKAELQRIEKELARLEAIAGAAGTSAEAQRNAESAFREMETKRDALLKRLEGFEAAKKKGDNGDLKLEDLLAKSSNKRSLPPRLAREGETFIAGDLLGESDAERQTAELKTYGQELVNSLRAQADIRERIADAQTTAAIRLIELTENEYEAAEKIRDIKLATAETVIEQKQAELDYTVRIAELDKARLDKYKETAANVYRSIRQRGGGGLRDLLIGQFDIQGEKIFANASAEIFRAAGSQLGKIGAAIPGGAKLFEGTLFDPKNAEKPIDRNTTAIGGLTRSVDRLTAKVSGGGLPIPGVPGAAAIGDIGAFISDGNGITGQGGGGILSKIPGFNRLFGSTSKSGVASAGFFGGLGSVAGGLFQGLGGDFSVATGDGKATSAGTSGRIGNTVGSAALVGLGTLGVIQGIREGGARGLVGAAGSALGVAAAIPGPQQPFIAAAALVAGLVKGLIPSGKETFEREQAETLNSRRYEGPEAQERSYDFATGGDSVDYDWRGRTRIVNRTVQVNINALDSRSVMDRASDIADAMGAALDGDHPARLSVQRVVFGAGV